MNNFQEDYKQEMTYGIHPLMEAISAGKEIEKVYIQRNLQSQGFKELMALIKEFNIVYQFVPVEKMNRISRKNHQGIIAIISPDVFYQNTIPIQILLVHNRNPFRLQ